MTTNDNRTTPQTAPVRRRRWEAWILLPAIFGAVTGAALSARAPRLYKSETLIVVVPQRIPESYVRSSVATTLSDRLQFITQQILSRTRLERVIKEFDLYSNERRNGSMEEIIERMRKNVEVKLEVVDRGDAVGFRVGFSGTEPRTVMKVAERLASLFILENLRDREVLAESTSQFLSAQLEDVRRRLVEQNGQLRAATDKRLPEAETLAIEYEVQQATFKDLLAKIEESRLASALERRQIGEQFKLLDPARLPERPIAPDRRKYAAIGAGAGAAVGVLLLLLVPTAFLRKRIETASVVE